MVKDVPGGLDDSVERLVRAAGLRCFVPPGMVADGTSPAVAFQLFRALPPQLVFCKFGERRVGRRAAVAAAAAGCVRVGRVAAQRRQHALVVGVEQHALNDALVERRDVLRD